MKTQTLLIASSMAPSERTWSAFEQAIRAEHSDKLIIGRVGVTDGPCCMNLTVEVTAEQGEFERFANGLTIALMPSKWTTTNDEPLQGYHLSK